MTTVSITLEEMLQRQEMWKADLQQQLYEAKTPEKWRYAFDRLARNDMPWALETAWLRRQLDSETLRYGLEAAWTAAEFPSSWVRHRNWLAMFGQAGYLTDESETPQPTDRLTIYRGTGVRTPPRRMSWTLSLETARWFANRWDRLGKQPGIVYSATIYPDGVLACFCGGRNEQEVVVNPRKIRNIEILNLIAQDKEET